MATQGTVGWISAEARRPAEDGLCGCTEKVLEASSQSILSDFY